MEGPPRLLSVSGNFISHLKKMVKKKNIGSVHSLKRVKCLCGCSRQDLVPPVVSEIEIKGYLIIFGFFLFLPPFLCRDGSSVLKGYITLQM